jgi:hypothetical protein
VLLAGGEWKCEKLTGGTGASADVRTIGKTARLPSTCHAGLTVTPKAFKAAQRLWQPESVVVLSDSLFFSQQLCGEALAEDSSARHGDPTNKVTSAKLVRNVSQPRLMPSA